MRNCIGIIVCLCLSIACNKDSSPVSENFPNELLYAKRGEQAGIYDQEGRYILLRGVNYNSLGDYWQGNAAIPTVKPYDKNDFALMASYGFNCVRLIFNWSALEPERGKYDRAYIQKIQQAIEDAAQYNIYVLVDMHQDAWGKHIATPKDGESCSYPSKGWDGAPLWATITDSASTCTVNGGRESAPAVYHAFQNFWDNTAGIQDACISAWAELIKYVAGYSNVVGYDILNEPGLGYKELGGEIVKISQFYSKCITAFRKAEDDANGYEHILFFETSITWNGGALPTIPNADYLKDENLVFAPHNYFESISYELTIEQGYGLLTTLNALYKTHMLIGEWGFFGTTDLDVPKIKRFAKLEDRYLFGSTWWQWAQAPGDPHGMSWDGLSYDEKSLHLLEIDKNGNYTGIRNEAYLNVLSRSRPLAIAGSPLSFQSNPDDGTMSLKANKKQQGKGITRLWIPDRFGTPKVEGTNIGTASTTKVMGGYYLDIPVQGNYKIAINF
jgi:endoglycosylceramidase